MKHIKLLTILGLALFAGTKLFAEPKPSVNRSFMPYPGQFISEAVYISSTTCVAPSTNSVIISTVSAFLYGIDVSSAGSGIPIIEVYDARHSTSVVGVRVVAKYIDGRVNRFYPFNVGLSSGLAVYNYAISGAPACIDILYYQR